MPAVYPANSPDGRIGQDAVGILSGRSMGMDRKDEIIELQMKVIQQMTENNLRRLSDDLWGIPGLRAATAQPRPSDQIPKDSETDPGGNVDQEVQKAGEEQPAEENAQAEDMDALKRELYEYIGLTSVKKEVESLINLVTVQKLRRQNDLPVEELSLHMVFSGNPGTGKTMVARLMARIYRCLGILSKGQLVEVDRSGLVAGYVGQTALKTMEVVTKAMGGVLFIDEAYALTNRGGTDFGQEAVDTLLKAMEDHREDLIIIVAGYTELMEAFVHSNPGLESRFNRFLFFPDYSVQEMMEIFEMRCQKSGYCLAQDAKELLRALLALLGLDTKGFGNARGVRNLFERAVCAQANRLAQQENVTRDELMLLTAEDIRAAGGRPDEAEAETEKEEEKPG